VVNRRPALFFIIRFLVFPVGRNWRLVLAKDGSRKKSSQKLQFGDRKLAAYDKICGIRESK